MVSALNESQDDLKKILYENVVDACKWTTQAAGVTGEEGCPHTLRKLCFAFRAIGCKTPCPCSGRRTPWLKIFVNSTRKFYNCDITKNDRKKWMAEHGFNGTEVLQC